MFPGKSQGFCRGTLFQGHMERCVWKHQKVDRIDIDLIYENLPFLSTQRGM